MRRFVFSSSTDRRRSVMSSPFTVAIAGSLTANKLNAPKPNNVSTTMITPATNFAIHDCEALRILTSMSLYAFNFEKKPDQAFDEERLVS